MTDWYRRKTWTQTDEEEFFAKLNRARKGSREQYLKIQAIELLSTNNSQFLDIAETLLLKLINEYPDDQFNRSSALESLGEIYARKHDIDNALNYYKQAIDFENKFPNVLTNAYLKYSELVVRNKKTELYSFVESIISTRLPGLLFPVDKYKAFAILSIINSYHGKKDVALEFAQLARESSTAKTSGLQYHKDLGLVDDKDKWLDDFIKDK